MLSHGGNLLVNKHNDDLFLSDNEIRYAWFQLLYRAGFCDEVYQDTKNNSIDIPFYYQIPNKKIRKEKCIVVIPCRPSDPISLINSKPKSISYISLHDVFSENIFFNFEDPIPILFRGDYPYNCELIFARIEENALIFYSDIIMATFFMLTRWEELFSTNLDIHGRFLAQNSVSQKQNFLNRPIIDEYALIFRSWVQKLLPSLTAKKKNFEVILSHDIDNIYHFNSIKNGFKSLFFSLITKKNIKIPFYIIYEMYAYLFSKKNLSNFKSIKTLAEISLQNNMKSVFYFMVSNDYPYDSDYDINSEYIQKLIYYLIHNKFEIGLHPGYSTLDDFQKLKEEVNKFNNVTGLSKFGVRQHYLRFHQRLWHLMNELNIYSDSSLGYPDHEGFRAGTCHPYHPFDLRIQKKLQIIEIPLIIMDATLKRYRKISPQDSFDLIIEFAKKCYLVEGTFTLLWHNNSIATFSSPWNDIYIKVIKELRNLMISQNVN